VFVHAKNVREELLTELVAASFRARGPWVFGWDGGYGTSAYMDPKEDWSEFS
jgi:hypothetical protein